MKVQCATRFTIVLNMPKKPFITFRCEREAHEGDEHYTTGKGGESQIWKMSWTETEIRDKEKKEKK